MSGNVGSARRLEYAAIGDTTNTAARLEAMTKGTPYQLYVADSTRERLAAPPEDLEPVGELEVRGREHAITRLGPARLTTASTPRAVASQVKPRGAAAPRVAQALALGRVGEQAGERVAERLARPAGRAAPRRRTSPAARSRRRRRRACRRPSPPARGARSPRSATGARRAPRRRRGPGSSASGTAPSSRSASSPCSAANCGRWPPATTTSTPSGCSARAAGTSAARFLRAACAATHSTYGRARPSAARARAASAPGWNAASTPPATTWTRAGASAEQLRSARRARTPRP